MINLDLYEKIKELAAQKHVSIRQIEEHLGYGNGTIRRWSKQTPGVDKVRAVAKYFNVSIDYLLGHEEKSSHQEPIDLATYVLKTKWGSMNEQELIERIILEIEKYGIEVIGDNYFSIGRCHT